MHLSGKIFSWPYDHQSRRFASTDDYVFRPREIWRHARDRLSGQAGDLDRTDCMTSLKRTINHRLKALEAEYAISTMPTTRSKKQVLETLQDYGLVRPSLLAELMKVRNDIEHKDTTPPDLQTCHMYVDVVWYFLKSTDQLLDMFIADIVYADPETNSALTLEFQTASTWQVKVNGVVTPNLLCESQREDDLEILDYTRSPRSTDKAIRFSGIVNLEHGTFLRLAHDYFGVQGYAYEDSGV